MNLGFCSLASGSSGNCYIIKSKTTNLMLDCGISYRSIKTGLESLGLAPDDINGIFITHEHTDHIKGLRTLLKNTTCPVFASHGTLECLIRKTPSLPYERLIEVHAGMSIETGDIKVKVFDLSHDAEEPVSFTFTSGEYKACVVTDTGFISDTIFDNIMDCDILGIEANHERNILLYGSYPYPLKLRILSDVGHLSNEACAHCLSEILKSGGRPKVFLAHLSKENNTPEQAFITVKNILEEEGYLVGKDLELKVLMRDKSSELCTV